MQVLRLTQPSAQQARWQAKAAPQDRTRLFTHRGEIYAAQRLHECQLPRHESLLLFRLQVRTTEFGQKIFLGLAALDAPRTGDYPAGLGVSLDPETGLIEDVFGHCGMLGDVCALPQEAGRSVDILLQARYYGLTFIPTLQVGAERVALPAMLLSPGQTLTALAGGVLSQGALPTFEHTELSLRSSAHAPMIHG